MNVCVSCMPRASRLPGCKSGRCAPSSVAKKIGHSYNPILLQDFCVRESMWVCVWMSVNACVDVCCVCVCVCVKECVCVCVRVCV